MMTVIWTGRRATEPVIYVGQLWNVYLVTDRLYIVNKLLMEGYSINSVYYFSVLIICYKFNIIIHT